MLKSLKFVVFLFVFFLLLTNLSATTIRCNNKTYAGKSIVFYQWDDPITNSMSKAFKMQLDAKGFCSVDINIEKLEYFFSDFGVYRGMLLVEEGKTLELKLPPLREKTFVDEKNPYFQPISFWFITEDGNHLNDRISEFEQQLNVFSDKHFNELYLQQSRTVFDSLSIILTEFVNKYPDKALEVHKNLQLKMLESDVFRLRPESFTSVFENIDSRFWLHPAFMDALNKTFDRQLNFSARAIGGDRLRKIIATEDLTALLEFIGNKYEISGKSVEIVALKMLHDGFYSDEFNQQNIKNLVRNTRFTNNKTGIIKVTSTNLIEKFDFLSVGSIAPPVCLKNLEGEKLCSDEGKDKFKYIVFADFETAVSREHLKYLSRIDELFRKNLDIFVVLRNTNLTNVQQFVDEQKLTAEILPDINGDYIKEYKIRSFPQCFLLDENHHVVFENTKAPLDGFEQQFGSWLRNELFQRQRNQSK